MIRFLISTALEAEPLSESERRVREGLGGLSEEVYLEMSNLDFALEAEPLCAGERRFGRG